jgi:hypothetical protein
MALFYPHPAALSAAPQHAAPIVCGGAQFGGVVDRRVTQSVKFRPRNTLK